MDSVKIKAHGKVNLGLDVTGVRPDGYHLVKMIMQTVDVYDEITVSATPENTQKRVITISCNNPEVPTDGSNLVYKAAMLVFEKYNLYDDIHIDILKNIPAAAGMAGGSADGAAVITALDELFNLSMSQEIKDEIALKLGADVPFCLRKGTYLSEGIGEILTKIADIPECFMVIVKPPLSVSTPWAYKGLDQYINEHPGCESYIHPDIDSLIKAIEDKNISDMAAHMGNVLELATANAYPIIQELKDQLEEMGAVKALMSGSGPTVFGIFTDENKAEEAYSRIGGAEYGKFKIKL